MRRSHLSTKKNTMVHRVDRREPKVGGKRLSDNGKSALVESMKLKPNGYGSLDELERRLNAITPKPSNERERDAEISNTLGAQ